MNDIKKDVEIKNEVLDIISNSSLSDFLKNEENCEDDSQIDSIFDEISKLTSLGGADKYCHDDGRTIEDILKEAEALINQPLAVESKPSISCESTPLEMKNNNFLDEYDYSTTLNDVSTKHNF